MTEEKQDKSLADNAAKFAFFYMLALFALIFTALSTGMVIFQIINKHVADALSDYAGRYSPDQLKFAISSLVIAVPVFFLTMRQIHKALYSGELDKDSGIRRWLTYFILFVSSVVMIVWLIMTIQGYLDGELSLKFGLKALTAIGIAAATFIFFFYDIRREKAAGEKDKMIKAFAIGSLAFVIAVFLSGLLLVESPKETRLRKLDNTILDDFTALHSSISSYYIDQGGMPDNLQVIQDEFPNIGEEDLADESSGESYDFRVTGDKSYELCATFRTDNTAGDTTVDGYYREMWPHGSGRQCLGQTIRGKGNEPGVAPRPLPAR